MCNTCMFSLKHYMDFTSTDECESAAGNTITTLHFPHFLFVEGRNNREHLNSVL